MNDEKIHHELEVKNYSSQLIVDLLLLPEYIKKEEKRLLSSKYRVSDIKRSISIWELKELVRISNESDEKGKKIYSNEKLREAELQRRKDSNPQMIESRKELDDIKNKYDKIVIELTFLNNRFKSLRSICLYLGGK